VIGNGDVKIVLELCPSVVEVPDDRDILDELSATAFRSAS
jgi:DNA-binding protein YbaB